MTLKVIRRCYIYPGLTGKVSVHVMRIQEVKNEQDCRY